jgi:hypothetical protein
VVVVLDDLSGLPVTSGGQVVTFSVFCFVLLRESFPFDHQFNILMRFIVDQTQTPNLKVQFA